MSFEIIATRNTFNSLLSNHCDDAARSYGNGRVNVAKLRKATSAAVHHLAYMSALEICS
jgi:hypothetical protein